jgi:hypothetical protein
MNKENFRLALEQIKAHPEQWDQGVWHCGTRHCIAGWGQILSGKPADSGTARRDARIFFDLGYDEADCLFGAGATLEEFEAALEDGYDRAGYDRAGYNRAGYDRAGLDRAGYDCAGYDRDGLDKDNKPKPEAA